MELISYLGKIVHIERKNYYFYVGEVISADDNSITILDKYNDKVSISKDDINIIREVGGSKVGND